MNRVAPGLALLLASASVMPGCSLNPQPLPPGDNPDSSVAAPGLGGSSSSGGGTNTATGDGGTDASVSDAGKAANDAPGPVEDATTDADASSGDAPSEGAADGPQEAEPPGD
jgi:hypothetical protein